MCLIDNRRSFQPPKTLCSFITLIKWLSIHIHLWILTTVLLYIFLVFKNQKLKLGSTYCGSTLAVASSMTSILLLRTMARARHTSCLCPTLRLLPPSDITPLSPPAKSWTTSFSSTCHIEFVLQYSTKQLVIL